MTSTDVPGSALRRLVRRPGSGVPGVGARSGTAERERCELCGEPLLGRHRHLLDEQGGQPVCACQGCALLFSRPGAGLGRYRLIPDQRTRLPEISVRELGVPVGLAFFVARPDGSVVAHYPSPLGITRWDVQPDAWRRVVQRCPPLAELEPGLRALLVNTARGAREHWIVPVDDCYRLVALVRGEWRGLSGGPRVWPVIERFFAELAASHG